MSVEQSETKQKEIENLKKHIDSAFKGGLISDLILLEYPKWSIYYKEGDSNHSFNYDCFTNAAIYKHLKSFL